MILVVKSSVTKVGLPTGARGRSTCLCAFDFIASLQSEAHFPRPSLGTRPAPRAFAHAALAKRNRRHP